MHTPDDFIRSLCSTSSTDLQKTGLYRDQWAGTSIDWDSAIVQSISMECGLIKVHLTMGIGYTDGDSIYHKVVNVLFDTPTNRASEFSQFSHGQRVRVTGILSDIYTPAVDNYCSLREGATLLPRQPPPPPKPIQLDLPEKQSNSWLGRFLIFLPVIAFAVLLYLCSIDNRVNHFTFPSFMFSAKDPLLGKLIIGILVGVFVAPFMLVFYILGQILQGIFGSGISRLWETPSDGETIDKLWTMALVFGSLCYGSILYWMWYFSRRCPKCSSLRRHYVGEKFEEDSFTSPDMVVTKRYNSNGDYIGYLETEVGESTQHYSKRVKRYKCRACGNEWSV